MNDFLSADRARAWCQVLAAMSALMIVGWVALSHEGVDPSHKPLGTDFVGFYTASQLALAGVPEGPYEPAVHFAAQRRLFPAAAAALDYTAFFYPPPFLLICLPLALLPYLGALVAWMGASFSVLFVTLRKLLPQPWAVLPIIAAPASLINLGNGQNGFLSAACLSGAMLWLETRPMAAGACLGVLIYKPQLLLAAPVALLAARRWRVIAGGVASSCVLLAGSWAMFGSQTWRAFLANTALARQTMTQGLVSPAKFESVYAATRVMHGSLRLGLVLQGVTTLVVLSVLAVHAWRRPGARCEGAMLACATLLSTPFVLDYDLTCLLPVLAWLMAQAQRTGWRRAEKSILLAAYVLPLFSRALATAGVPIAPAVMLALFFVASRRTLSNALSTPGFAV